MLRDLFADCWLGGNDCMPGSRHGLPLSFVVVHIESAARKTALIGIKPAGLPFGEELSPVVEAAARVLNELLRRNDLDEIPQQEFHL